MAFFRKLAITLRTAAKHRRPLRYFASRVLIKTGLCNFLTVKRRGYVLRFVPANLMATMWLTGESYYAEEEAFIQSLLRPGDNFVDVGANVGNLSIVGKLRVGHGKVIAVEAHPRTAKWAKGNFDLNGLDIEVLNFVAGERPGAAIFSDSFADDMNAVTGGPGISVPMESLDNLIQLTHVRLIKMDVEGYELMALKGSGRLLSKTKYVYFEVWEQLTERYGYRPADLIEFFDRHSFDVFRLGSLDRALSPDADFSALENVLAVSRVPDRAEG